MSHMICCWCLAGPHTSRNGSHVIFYSPEIMHTTDASTHPKPRDTVLSSPCAGECTGYLQKIPMSIE